MTRLSSRRGKRRQRAAALFAAGLALYFIAHALIGERGFFALSHQRQDVALLRQQAEALAQRRQHLEREVTVLREEHLDLDVLEEHVRRSLGWSEANEQSFLDPDGTADPVP